jgi:hypothetical protein
MEEDDDDSDTYDNSDRGGGVDHKRFPVHDCCEFGSLAALVVSSAANNSSLSDCSRLTFYEGLGSRSR